MDIFGARWENHTERLRENWQSVVSPDDTVIIPGEKVYLKTWGFASDAPKQIFHEVIGKVNTCAPVIDGEREPLPE